MESFNLNRQLFSYFYRIQFSIPFPEIESFDFKLNREPQEVKADERKSW